MLRILIEKELKAILLSPKFVATFGGCALLILLSVFIGIQEYRAALGQYETARQLTEQQLQEATSWWGVNLQVYRAPDPMQIFVSGVNNDVGRLSDISTWREVKLKDSIYTDDTLFAVFRFIDFVFIVQVVPSLFAILFTYDAINGELESGTLKLALSNAVPRGKYLLAKFVGAWLGLTVPLMIPILLGALIVLLMNVPMEAAHWVRLGTLLGASILYFTFFITLGLLVSALTRRSSISFLILLVAWIVLVLITPRAATMAAGQLIHVPSVSEIESQKDRFSTDCWTGFQRERQAMWEDRNRQMEGMSEEERNAFREQNENLWAEEDDNAREAVTADIAEFARKLNEDLRNQKAEQERLAFMLSRFSPAASYQFTVMNLGGTNITLKTRYEDAMRDYRTRFADFVEAKRREEMEKNRRAARGSGVPRFFGGGDEESLDTRELPRFEAPREQFAAVIGPSMVDLGLLAFFSILAFAGAFVAFIRYDVR